MQPRPKLNFDIRPVAVSLSPSSPLTRQTIRKMAVVPANSNNTISRVRRLKM